MPSGETLECDVCIAGVGEWRVRKIAVATSPSSPPPPSILPLKVSAHALTS